MVTKAIIRTSSVPGGQPRVNIIKYGQVENSPGAEDPVLYPVGTICALPGVSPKYKDGDIVYINVEDNNLSKPVIIGLVSDIERNKETLSDAKHSSLEVTVNAILPEDTTIGKVSMKALSNLAGLATNVQAEMTGFNTSMSNILQRITTILNSVND